MKVLMYFTNGNSLRFEEDGDTVKIGKGEGYAMTKFEALNFVNRLKDMLDK